MGADLIEYTVIKSSQRRKTLTLTVDAHRGAVVAVPMRTPRAQIESFVASHAGWIAQRTTQLAERPAPPTLEGRGSLPFQDQMLRLEIIEQDAPRARAQLEGTTLRVPIRRGLGAKVREQAIRDAVVLWYGGEASRILAESVAHWAQLGGYHPKSVLIRDQRRRWGSCSTSGIVRLNWHIVAAPLHLVDYVVVHELAHLRVPNHSAEFWAEVARLVPDHRARRAELRRIESTLWI